MTADARSALADTLAHMMSSAKYNERLQCSVVMIHAADGYLYVTTGENSVPDMGGAVQMAAAIDPDISVIVCASLPGGVHTAYERRGDDWTCTVSK